MRRIVVSALLLFVFAAGPVQGLPEELQELRDAAVTRLLTSLDTLALEADELTLNAGRDTCYELILVFDPDHKAARRALRYVKKDEEWIQRPYRRPIDRNDEMAPLFYPRLREAVARFTGTILDALTRGEAEMEYVTRMKLVADVLLIDPDNARARSFNGEAEKNGKWVLIETVRAAERHKELRRLSKESLAAVPDPKKIEATADEKGWGVTWRGVYQGEWWRALGSVSKGEVRATLRCMDASHPVINGVFEVKIARPGGCGVYLLTGHTQAAKVLEAHPAFGENKRAYLLNLSAAWIPGRLVFFHYSDSADVRKDGSVRMAIGILLMRLFGITTERGWVWEGLGLYLDELITGTRRTIFVTRDIRTTTERERKLDIARRMKAPGANWISLALELYDAGVGPELPVMASRNVNDMTAEQLVVAYSLARYIVEGCPDQATRFFSLHGDHQKIEETVDAVFGLPFPAFMNRFLRWMKEK